MRRHWLRMITVMMASAAAMVFAPAVASAEPAGVVVYPGMEIRQDWNVCTLGFIDPQSRIAYTAGHCRGSGVVNDRDGNFIGHQQSYLDNTPDGATIDTNHQISDWQTIGLAGDVQINNVLPSGRPLVVDPAVQPEPGMPVCHYGVVTKESCGTIDAVNNGWFTMGNGVVSQKGDSGGPVYVPTPDGRAALIGMFNSTWGSFPTAVSWAATTKQAGQAVIVAASSSADAG